MRAIAVSIGDWMRGNLTTQGYCLAESERRALWLGLRFSTGACLALVVAALAILTKVVGCGLGAWGLGPRSMAIIGVGMAPRGEVGLIVANVGRSLDVIPDTMFSIVVIMSVLTTLVVPPVLTILYRGAGRTVTAAERDYAVADSVLPEL